MTDDRRQDDRRQASEPVEADRRVRARRVSDLPALIASRINAAMHRRRWTKRHLSIRAGVDERTVRNVLAGNDMRIVTIERLAAVLNLDLSELLRKPAA